MTSTPARIGHIILLVNDDGLAVETLRTLLERKGHRVLTAASVASALTTYRENDVSLVVVDSEVDRRNGMELVRAIRSFDPFVRIIVQTRVSAARPAQEMLDELDVQGYQDELHGPERLMTWISVGLSASRTIHALRDRERTYSELVANISHEFRTPLNIVAGYIELLLDGSFGTLPSAATAPLQAVDGAIRNLTEVVSNFLEHAKIDAGCGELAEQITDVRKLAVEIERLGRLLLDTKPVGLSVDADGAPAAILTDEVKLRTILRNLVGNAAKFTAQGLVAVRFTARDRWLQVSVTDTGPGISVDDMDEIFRPFRQADGSSRRLHGGIGLGLALSRKYAQLLGGTLTVESVPGLGSTFTLLVPARQPPTGLAVPAAADAG